MSSTTGSQVSVPQVSGDLISLTIDGRAVTAAKGTNLIEAAASIGVEIPHYCYHKNLSIAGNCRMCQVEVVGGAKLEIACNCAVREGMVVKTQATSQIVADAQSATLEFILINHPLDCTVCDQAGHCKLQDYHFEYNAKESRFLENKEHKIKALPLGPHVMLDGERCILCTRCVRFTDEITKTHELGVLHRGDRAVITTAEGKELNNPLSGTVVDLCPVGALTHRDWRFNSRIWFSKQTDTICPGCSTGCNVKIAVRDGEVVQVKARDNQAVNKEWMCDEGRYGMERFLPKERVLSNFKLGSTTSPTIDAVVAEVAKAKNSSIAVFVSPFLLTEEMVLLKALIAKHFRGAQVAVGYRERKLSSLEQILIAPNYAPNIRGAVFAGLAQGSMAQMQAAEKEYDELLAKVRGGGFNGVMIFGDRAVEQKDLDPAFLKAVGQAQLSFAVLSDADSALSAVCGLILAGRSILEKSGILINRDDIAQWNERSIEPPPGTVPEWQVINKIALACGAALHTANTERELAMSLLAADSRFAGQKLMALKNTGIKLSSVSTAAIGTAENGELRGV